MKQFKKRTIALILASVVTVVGAFGADNYKNSLMALKFDSSANGDVNITVLTKTNYDNEISSIRKDANTYVIMLPETNSEMSEPPQVSGNIESIDVKTMPYTTGNKGYTKITVKTFTQAMLTTQKAVFLPEFKGNSSNSSNSSDAANSNNSVSDNWNYVSSDNSNVSYIKDKNNTIEDSIKQFKTDDYSTKQNVSTPTTTDTTSEKAQQDVQHAATTVQKETVDPTERLLLILAGLFIVFTSIFFFIRGKNKLKEVMGEDFSYDINEDTPKNDNKKDAYQDIRNTIKTLDRSYNKPKTMAINMPNMMPKVQEATKPLHPETDAFSAGDKKQAEDVIVDLDQLYMDANSNSDDSIENQDIDMLAEFLNDYENQEKEKQQEQEFIEQQEQETNELYERFINNEDFSFSKDDIQKINDILRTEISDEAIDNIKKKEVSNPIRQKNQTKEEILENFITTLTIKQNISFSHEDVAALRKLISVEIDSEFVNDLRTNPERMKSMQREIEDRNNTPHRVSELLTLNVDEKLPNLSNIALESKSVNYEAPSKYKLAETEYEIDTLKVDDSLPDLKDVMAHPEKYSEPKPEKVVIDEDALLRNITNASFKPFYDGTQEFEVINDLEDTESEMVDENSFNKEVNEISVSQNLNSSVSNKDRELEQIIENEKINKQETFTYNDESYEVVKRIILKADKECYFVKTPNGYSVFGNSSSEVVKLREYNEDLPKLLQARSSEILPNGSERFMVRCGKHKFVLEITDNKMEFIMDLC